MASGRLDIPFAVLLAAVLAAPTPVRAEDLDVGVDSCRLALEPVVQLGGELVARGIVRGDPAGFWFVPYYSEHEIIRFDSQGRMTRVLDRKGLGPREFNRIRDVVPIGGGLAVFQSEPARLTYLDGEGNYVDSHPLPVAMRSVAVGARSDSTYLLSGYPVLPTTVGAAFVRVDGNGRLLTAYTEGVEEPFSQVPGHVMPRVAGFGTDDRLVSVEVHDLVVEQWDPAGGLIDRSRHEVEWFDWPGELANYLTHGPGGTPGPPENTFLGLQVDSENRLWVLAKVTPDDWERGVSGSEIVDLTAWADGFIQVMDLDAGTALCSLRVDQLPLFGFVAPGRIATYAEDRDGVPTISVWDLVISR